MSTLSPADIAILAVYLAAIVWLGLSAARKRRAGLEDYLLASRTLTLPSFVATLVPSFFGGVLGVGEYTYRYGVSNWTIQGAPYYVFALLYAWLLAGRIRKFEGRTLPDHLESVYGKGAAVMAAVWITLLSSTADETLMLGSVVRWATGWPLGPCVILAAACGLSILALGGLRSDVWTNRLEFVVMYSGFFMIVPAAFLAVGGFSGLAAKVPPLHLDFTGGQPLSYLLTWFFIAFWTFVDPGFHQRVCAAKDARTARVGIGLSVCFWFAFDCMTTWAGLTARALLPNLADPLLAYPTLASRLLPPVARGLFIAGMSSSMIAALAAMGFVSATSLAKDAAGRLLDAPPERQELWVRWGLLVTGASSVALALYLPSVVGLWYAEASATIPGLLVPMLSCYFPSLRVGPRAALACSALGGGAALSWLMAGHLRGTSAAPAYPLGIEPFYPGLAVSLLIWAAGKWAFGPRRADLRP